MTHTCQQDSAWYPAIWYSNIKNSDAKVLRTGIFYAARVVQTGKPDIGSVWDSFSEDNWFGLFNSDSVFYLERTKLEIQDVFIEHPCDSAGKKVKTVNRDSCIVLIHGLGSVSSKKIEYVDVFKEDLFPGDTIKFEFLGVEYKIHASGCIDSRNKHNKIRNYKLYLTADLNGHPITELLVARPDRGKWVRIIFAGDIDGDGYLDLFIDTTYDNSQETYTLLHNPLNPNVSSTAMRLTLPLHRHCQRWHHC